MADTKNLEDQLVRLFAEKLNIVVPSVDTELIDTGLVDSLAFVRFVAQLELEFDIQMSLKDLEIDPFRTISRIARFLETKGARAVAADSG